MAKVFDKLGREVLPKVFGKLSGVGLTDLMTVEGETTTVGSGGGRIKSARTIVYSNIPVIFQPTQGGGVRVAEGDQPISTTSYYLRFPSHATDGSRYNIDPKQHRLIVTARTGSGDEPQKTFRILAIRDLQGNLFEAHCIKEN